MGTIEGLASMFLDFLLQASWADRVNILNALLRLLPDVTGDLRIRLQAKLLYLLNQDDPPKLQVSPSLQSTLYPEVIPEPTRVPYLHPTPEHRTRLRRSL